MQITVGTTPVEVTKTGRGRPVIQNLGPGIVYLDSETTVSSTTGLQLQVGDVYEFASASAEEAGIFVVSDTANTDVRVVTMGA